MACLFPVLLKTLQLPVSWGFWIGICFYVFFILFFGYWSMVACSFASVFMTYWNVCGALFRPVGTSCDFHDLLFSAFFTPNDQEP